jgi:2-hydroxy-3-oxopropionate reductase
MDTAKTYGIPLPLSAVVLQLYTAMLEQGNRELDNSGIISVYESLTGIKLSEPLKQ